MTDAKLIIRDLSVVFHRRRGGEVVAVDGLSLTVQDKEFVCIVGPSGCGKSTLLRVIAGLSRPQAGEVTLDGERVTAPGADRGMVFQSYTLFPWLTVQGNVEFGPRLSGRPSEEYAQVARRYIDLVGLAGFEHAYPKELSGGMQQRAAIARALANDPEILLMDEPFGALDAQTRSLMQELLLRVWEQTHKTVLFVTHDIEEAILLADRIYVMTARPGRIKHEVRVPLPRPRTVAVLDSDGFIRLRREVYQSIREESLKVLVTTEDEG
ncbi:MAG TPA: ABC transporter ATP-binding protein [bacterium]|jgi:NitT/TauT family transport system ATP-binding protein